MKNKKQSKYGKVKKTLIAGASTGIVATMLLLGGNVALAETVDQAQQTSVSKTSQGMHMMHRWNSNTKASTLASQLGINKDVIKQELQSGKTLKQVLQEHGIVPGQLQKAFGSKNKKNYQFNK